MELYYVRAGWYNQVAFDIGERFSIGAVFYPRAGVSLGVSAELDRGRIEATISLLWLDINITIPVPFA